MPSFSITPVTGYPLPASDEFPQFIQFQENGEDLGGPDADTVNFANGVTATRGTGESANVITVTAEGGGGGGPITWRSVTTDDTLVLGDAENGVATSISEAGTITIPPHADVAFDTGTAILVLWEAEGQPTIAPGAGVTLNVDANFEPSVAREQGIVSIINRDVDVWVLAGDMTVAGGVGEGTVTSVGLTMPDIFTVANSPVTTAGTLAVSLADQSSFKVFAGPTGTGADRPTFRALENADLPSAAQAFEWSTPAPGAYTLVLDDAENGVAVDAATVTIPPHSSVPFPDGTSIVLLDLGYMNPYTVTPGAGVTVQHRAAFQPISAGEYGTVTLLQYGINNWILAGDLEAV